MQVDEYIQRRMQLLRTLGDGGVVIIPTAPEQVRNRDVHFPFRPNSDFYYLTGFAEPQAVLVLVPGRAEGESLLFCRDKDPKLERWEGSRMGVQAAPEQLGVDQAFAYAALDQQLPALLGQAQHVFYDIGLDIRFDQCVLGWLAQAQQSRVRGQTGLDILALSTHLHTMRLRKSPAELARLRVAACLSAKAHRLLMQRCRPGMYEYTLAADFAHVCQAQGAHALAYPSIVGGGNNACVLHYTENTAPLVDGDLVLVDAGCELDWYASDITRTFPVNGCFNRYQRQLYELVLAAQQAAIAEVRSGQTWNQPHIAAVRVLTEGLLRLGLLQGELEQSIRDKSYQRFFMHRTSHWLGLDVHDVGTYQVDQEQRLLEPGMVLTIEPGLYIPRGSEGVSEQWQGIGIRIEDDVVVTVDKPEVISAGVPRSVEDIEVLMNDG